ncbi:MAG: hypothetical protein EPO46_11520 [Lysobacter sp.]|nr:MAG: hypothetical protein EPO46_11520 [Lysobacter sp.]
MRRAIAAVETYVIRTVPVESIDAAATNDDAPPVPTREDIKAALRFDGPIAAAEVLLAPPGEDGRYRVLAGHDGMERAREYGRGVVLAAVTQPDASVRHVLGRWQAHHAA